MVTSGDLANVQAITCSERREGLEKGNAEADPAEKRGKAAAAETSLSRAIWVRATRISGSAGVVAMACMQEEEYATREPHSAEGRDLQPDAREGQAGP